MSFTISDNAKRTLTEWLDQLMTGQLGLDQLPSEIAAFYHLGHIHAIATQQERIDQLEHEAALLYVAAFNPREIATTVTQRMTTDEYRAYMQAEKQALNLLSHTPNTTTEGE